VLDSMLTCSSTRSYLAGMKRAPDRSQKLPLLRQFESFPFPIKNVVGKSTCGVSTAISEMPRLHATSLPTTFFADCETSRNDRASHSIDVAGFMLRSNLGLSRRVAHLSAKYIHN